MGETGAEGSRSKVGEVKHGEVRAEWEGRVRSGGHGPLWA